MYLSDSTLHSAIDGISRTLGIYVEVEGAEYAPASIIRLEWENECIDGSNFTIGGTLSNRIELEIYHDESILVGDQIKPSVEIEVEGEMIRIPLGIFYVDSVSVNKEITTLTAYDAMISLDKEYIPSTNHTSLRALASDVCQQAGILMKGEIEDIPIARSLEGYSYRETLGFIASFHAGNMVVDRDGQFKIKTYEVVDRTIPNHAYFSFDQKDTYRVSAVMCNFGSIGIGRGDDTAQCVTFENPYVTEEHIDRIYLKLKDLTFVAGKLNYRGDMNLDAGDLFTLTDANGQDHLLLCGQNQLTFTGGLTGTLNSIGEGQGANQYVEYKFKNKKSITQLTVEMGKIQAEVSEVEKKLENDYSTTEETKSLVTQTATEISSVVARQEVQNMEIGGRNLIKNTPNILLQNTDNSGNHNSCSLVDGANSVYVRIAPTVDGNVYDNVTSCEKLIQGEWYTISFEFWNDSGSPVGFYWYPSEHYVKNDHIPSIAGKWQKVSFTYQQTGATGGGGQNHTTSLFGFHQLKAGVRYAYTNLQLERGKIATSWSPSPSDYSTTTQMNSAIQQKADEINLSVSNIRNGLTNENLLVGSFDYTPTTYWYQPSNTAISSSQKLYDCKVWYTEVDWGGIKVNLKYLLDRGVFEVGKPCTFSMYARTNSGTCKLGAYMHHWGQGDFTVTTQWKQFSFTFTPNQSWIDEITDTNTMRFEPYNLSGTGIRFYGACYKLERGTIATPWATNSSDVSLVKQQADSITSTVNANYTTLNNKFNNYPTTTQMNSAITQKANEITSNVNMTKIAGVELLPQGYRRNSTSGYYIRSGSGNLNVSEYGLCVTVAKTWVSTDFIAIDAGLPLEYYFFMQNTNGHNLLTCIGFEQYNWKKEEIGENAATIYVGQEKFTGYKTFRGTIPEGSFNSNTRYIKLRWLANWDSSTMAHSYIHDCSVKQLGYINSSTQIAQMADKIETKVDVNGVKSTIQQNPESVRIGFNAISNYFDLNSSRLQVGHSDGSYTQIGQNGIVYYDAYANWKYHSLMKQGWLGDISGTSWSRTITLPASFRNKTFSVIISIEMVNAVNTHDVIKHYKVTVPQNTVNYANGTFVVNMSALAYWVPGQGSATAITTNVSWIAIA